MGFAALNQILLERKNKLICQISDKPCRSKSFCSFLSTLYTTTYNIRFSTYSSNILYNNFNLVLKQTHSGTKTYQKLCYILVHKILFLIICVIQLYHENDITKFDHRKIYFLNNHPMPIFENCSISLKTF